MIDCDQHSPAEWPPLQQGKGKPSAPYSRPMGTTVRSICQTWSGSFAVTTCAVDLACSTVCVGGTGFSLRLLGRIRGRIHAWHATAPYRCLFSGRVFQGDPCLKANRSKQPRTREEAPVLSFLDLKRRRVRWSPKAGYVESHAARRKIDPQILSRSRTIQVPFV